MLNIGNLVPASYMKFGGEEYPDLFKFYTVMPTRSTESTAANQRRPVLYTSLNGGVRWCFESQSSGLYWANYGGNFYFNAGEYEIQAWAHKSTSSSYGAYKGKRGDKNTKTGISLNIQGWTTSSVVAYNTANQPNREICRCLNSNRYYCIKEGGGFVYNNDPWNTANWTGLSGPSGTTLTDDGGFCHMCVNTEKEHEALVFLVTNDSNKYLRFYLLNTNDGNYGTNYTSTVCFGSTTWKQTNYKYCSIGYLPKVGYLIFYNYSSGSKGAEVIILRTYDTVTGEMLPYNQYVADGPYTVQDANTAFVQYGAHGWYCPWSKEYYFCPNASRVLWSKDGISWTSSNTTGAAITARCQKLMTDGQSIVIATSGSAFYYSRDKGQIWSNDYTLSPNGFNTNRSTDTIVLPFKCTNNLGINKQTLVVGEAIGTDGSTTTNSKFFRTDYIPIDPNVLYVFYGSCTKPYGNISNRQKSWYNRILFYDSNHNFISGKEGADYTTTGSPTREVPCIALSPSNAAYAILCTAMSSTDVTTEIINSYNWYFAKESDFEVMTKYGDIVMN